MHPPLNPHSLSSMGMTSSNGNIFRVIGPLWGESTGHRWIPLTKASDAELWCFLWSAPEQTIERTTDTPLIRDATALIMTSLQLFIHHRRIITAMLLKINWTIMKTNIKLAEHFIWYSQHFEHSQKAIQCGNVVRNNLSFQPLPSTVVMETLHFWFKVFFQMGVSLDINFPCCNDDDTTCNVNQDPHFDQVISVTRLP